MEKKEVCEFCNLEKTIYPVMLEYLSFGNEAEEENFRLCKDCFLIMEKVVVKKQKIKFEGGVDSYSVFIDGIEKFKPKFLSMRLLDFFVKVVKIEIDNWELKEIIEVFENILNEKLSSVDYLKIVLNKIEKQFKNERTSEIKKLISYDLFDEIFVFKPINYERIEEVKQKIKNILKDLKKDLRIEEKKV